jgi:hypothetical protein
VTTPPVEQSNSVIKPCAGSTQEELGPLPALPSIKESIAPPTCEKPVAPPTQNTTLVPAASVPTVHAAPAEQTVPVFRVESAPDASYPLWLQVALFAAVMILCPLVAAVMLALVLRSMGMHLRVEVINSSPPGMPIIARLEGYGPVPAAPSVPPAVQETAAAHESRMEQTEPDTAERFDLGPSYEEEKQAKEEALRQRELAVLQELFAQNQRLYEEIEQLDDEGEESLADEVDEQGREE